MIDFKITEVNVKSISTLCYHSKGKALTVLCMQT